MPTRRERYDVAYDPDLAGRVREAFADADVDPVEQPMFGGLAFMVGGHMAVGVLGDDLVVRVGKEGYEDALGRPHTREMDFTGRPMTGMVYVGAAGTTDDGDLADWVGRALDHVAALPPK